MKDDVRLAHGGTVDDHLLIDEADVIARNTDHTLHEVLRWMHRVTEDDDVAAMDLGVGKNVSPESAAGVMDLIDEQVIADQQGVLHRFRGDLERLDDEGD